MATPDSGRVDVVGRGEGEALLDQSGRPLGPRAIEKRRQLMAATEALLEEVGLRELKVVDITRSIGCSPATFYQYFRDVEDAVRALADQVTREMPPILELLEDADAGSAGLAGVRQVVEAFIDHWDRHRAVLRVRNLAADEGDAGFLEIRSRAMTPLLTTMARRIERTGRGDLSPLPAAAALAAVLERLAAYHHELEHFGVEREALAETSARIIHGVLCSSG